MKKNRFINKLHGSSMTSLLICAGLNQACHKEQEVHEENLFSQKNPPVLTIPVPTSTSPNNVSSG